MTEAPVIIWLRRDLRLSDHPAFFAAKDKCVIPVYIHEEDFLLEGAAGRVWLHHSLRSLDRSLQDKGTSLIIRKGSAKSVLKQLIKETGAQSVYCTRRYEPGASIGLLEEEGIPIRSFCGQLLFEPWTVLNLQQKPYQVFTPFWKACHLRPVRPVLSDYSIKFFHKKVDSIPLDHLKLLPKIRWDEPLIKKWKPGEKGAELALEKFQVNTLESYEVSRDIPSAEPGVSLLSPHLHFGEISPYQVWNAVVSSKNSESFLRQLVWREFTTYILFHFPYVVTSSFKEQFNDFPWENNEDHLKAWKKGMTGYPIVDAGMRQLWQTGWMHNRVRMIVGSFLVKDLLISWVEGAKWFWDTLVDADLANNTFGWQWVGGAGVDAAPYFRIFNPIAQGEKFDPEGLYVKKYVPELKNLPKQWIHRPFEVPLSELRKNGIELGVNYPLPLVDHAKARLKALAWYEQIKN